VTRSPRPRLLDRVNRKVEFDRLRVTTTNRPDRAEHDQADGVELRHCEGHGRRSPEQLANAVAAVIDDHGGAMTVSYATELLVARRV
jgi:hypothetical protein